MGLGASRLLAWLVGFGLLSSPVHQALQGSMCLKALLSHKVLPASPTDGSEVRGLSFRAIGLRVCGGLKT